MAYYLSMDGVDDLLRSPVLTITRVVMDFVYENNNPPATTAYYLFDNRGGTPSGNYMVWVSTSNTLGKGSAVTTLLLDGVDVGATGPSVSTGVRHVIDATHTAVITDANGLDFFVNYVNQNTTRTRGRLYDIKLYNGATLIAHYDMTLGNVQDQSGNGYHATLTGGTWVDDGAGGTDATITAVPADVTADAIAPSITTASNVSVSSVIAESIAEAIAPIVGSAVTINAVVVDATASANVPTVDAVRNIGIDAITGDAVADAIAPFVGSSVSADITAVIAEVTVDAVSPNVSTTQDTRIDSVIANVNADGIAPTIQTDAVISAFAAELQAMANAPSLNAKVIIGVIKLNGKRELYVYLQGKRELNVALKGGL